MNSYPNLKGKKLLILAGADVHTKVVLAAKALGVYTIVTDYLSPQDAPAKQVADEYWMINITDIDKIVDQCRKERVDGVLSFCIDPAQLPYQKICEKLGVPCYGTKDQFEILTDKRRFKNYCKECGVDVVPEYSLEDVVNDKIIYPVLIKPADSRGSRGITICHCKEDIFHAIDFAKKESHNGCFLIERYMRGCQDMAFAYVVIGGNPYLVKIGDRYLGQEKDGLECQQIATILPSRNAKEYISNVDANVVSMIKSLGIEVGAVFLQGFWENGHVYMYDPGMRFPGSDFDVVLKHATGYDNMSTFVKFALTGDVNSKEGNPEGAWNYNGKVCLILSIAARPGKICKFDGMKIISSNPCVLSASKRYHCGETVPASGDVRQRVAEFVVFLPNREAIHSFISDVYDNLKIEDENGNDMIISKLDY